MNEILFWLDVETTGLFPDVDHLLEVAIVPTAMTAGFEPLGEPFVEQIALGPTVTLKQVSVDVLEMHAHSGLWRDCRSASSIEHVWGSLRRSIREWRFGDATGYLAGRSVHFDRGWMRAKAPTDVMTALNLSHRHFDLTAIKAFATITGLQFGVSEDAHRALADVLADIAVARELVQAVKG